MTSGFTPLVEPLGQTSEPAEVCARFLDLPYLLFLDSAAMRPAPGARVDVDGAFGPAHLQQYSFLTADPVSVVRSKGTKTEVRHRHDSGWTPVPGDALGAIADHRAANPPYFR